jgi:hypothetical protein
MSLAIRSKGRVLSNANLISTATVPSYALTFTNIAAGNYSVKATATGNLEGFATWGAIGLTVANNVGPTVSFTADRICSRYNQTGYH